jgi:colicin import membrane protein
VRLGDGGEVLDVKLVRSSGYSQLDNSATAAVYKASPLPVPGDPELFEKFREIRLLVKPQGYLG